MNYSAKTIEDYYYSDYPDAENWTKDRIDRDTLETWIGALQSGLFAQTKGRLNRVRESEVLDSPVGFCCLGVLAELAVREGLVEKTIDEHRLDTADYDGCSMFPPPAVYAWAGLPAANPVVWATVVDADAKYDEETDEFVDETSTRWVQVSELNDEYGWSFEQIATAIRATYL